MKKKALQYKSGKSLSILISKDFLLHQKLLNSSFFIIVLVYTNQREPIALVYVLLLELQSRSAKVFARGLYLEDFNLLLLYLEPHEENIESRPYADQRL